MFHKGKRRRRFIDFAIAESGATSLDGLSELARVAAIFEPARYELINDRQSDSPIDDPPRLQPESAEPVRTRTVSETPGGEKIFHFGCYPSATRFYLDRKSATPAASHQEAIHPKD